MTLNLILILIPVIIAVTGFLVLHSVRLGLKWQIETKKEQTPSPVIKNPLEPIMEAKQAKEQEQQQKETASIFQEWLYGEQEQ